MIVYADKICMGKLQNNLLQACINKHITILLICPYNIYMKCKCSPENLLEIDGSRLFIQSTQGLPFIFVLYFQKIMTHFLNSR